jgi:hypothetical protein
MLDPVLQRHQASLSGSAYITFQLSRVETARIKKIEVSDKARIGKFDVGLYGVLPGMFESTVPDFLNVDREQSVTLTGLPLGEQLYTARGSQGLALGSYIARQIGAYDTRSAK